MSQPLHRNSSLEDFEPLFERIETTSFGISTICPEFGITRPSFFRWIEQRPELLDRYARAKDKQIEVMAEEILTISDDGKNDWMQRLAYNGANPGWEINGENINRSRLRVDSRKWLLSKLVPKKYGDFERVEMSGEVNVVDALAAGRKRVAEAKRFAHVLPSAQERAKAQASDGSAGSGSDAKKLNSVSQK